MAKPRLIIIIRHAQSEGNKNRDIHQTVPDHRVKLTPDGWHQAREAGHRLRNLLRPDDTLHFFTSPYRRTRETTEGILSTLTSDEPVPSPFRRSNIKVYEEPRLREQDFGNFQPCSDEMERMWQERADYGHFFYRIPNGESAADAYDRVSGFNESLWRQFGEDDFGSVCVLVTHGLMSRVFLMKWYHFTVEYFEDLRNVNHCEFLIMRKQDNGKYLLENNLRTWSDLRRERALAEAAARGPGRGKDDPRDLDPAGPQPNPPKPVRQRTIPIPRQWGGCPNGCDHSRHYVKKADGIEQRLRQGDTNPGTGHPSTGHAAAAAAAVPAVPASDPSLSPATTATTATIASWQRQTIAQTMTEEGAEDDQDGAVPSQPSVVCPAAPGRETQPALPPGFTSSSSFDPDPDPERQDDQSTDPAVAAAAKLSHLHVGRDFGGTYSGHASTVGSDTDASEDEHAAAGHRHSGARVASLNTRIRIANAEALASRLEDAAAAAAAAPREAESDASDLKDSSHFVMRLGDMPNQGYADDTDADDDDCENLDSAEKEDRSISGSVY